MITIRQIERLWAAKLYRRLVRDCTAARPEASLRLEADLAGRCTAAAVAMVRLEELNRRPAPVFDLLRRAVVAGQSADGGWGDAASTAMCLRALSVAGDAAAAVERGIGYLHNLQRDDGLWHADPYLTALALLHLTADSRLRERCDDLHLHAAADWLDFHPAKLDAEARRLWSRTSVRCRGGIAIPS